jgi:hypothetical protein
MAGRASLQDPGSAFREFGEVLLEEDGSTGLGISAQRSDLEVTCLFKAVVAADPARH